MGKIQHANAPRNTRFPHDVREDLRGIDMPPPSAIGGECGEPLLARVVRVDTRGSNPELELEIALPASASQTVHDQRGEVEIRRITLKLGATDIPVDDQKFRMETDDADFTGYVRTTGLDWRLEWYADFHNGTSVSSIAPKRAGGGLRFL